jgi:hypothetical protein
MAATSDDPTRTARTNGETSGMDGSLFALGRRCCGGGGGCPRGRPRERDVLLRRERTVDSRSGGAQRPLHERVFTSSGAVNVTRVGFLSFAAICAV